MIGQHFRLSHTNQHNAPKRFTGIASGYLSVYALAVRSGLLAVLRGSQAGEIPELTHEIIAVVIAAGLGNARDAADCRLQQKDRLIDTRLNDVLMKADAEGLLVDLPEIARTE